MTDVQGRGVPVRCTNCGFLGRVPGLIGGSATNLTIVDSRVTCPMCGELAEILDGTYDMRDSVVELVAGPQSSWDALALILTNERWTAQRVAMVKRALESSAHGGKPEHVAERVRRIDPELGGWLKHHLSEPSSHGAMNLIALILTLLTYLQPMFDGEEKPAPVEVRQIVKQTVYECGADQANPDSQGTGSKHRAGEPGAPTQAQSPHRQGRP